MQYNTIQNSKQICQTIASCWTLTSLEVKKNLLTAKYI